LRARHTHTHTHTQGEKLNTENETNIHTLRETHRH